MAMDSTRWQAHAGSADRAAVRQARHAHRRPRLPRRRPGERRRARRRARLRRDPDLQPEPAAVEADGLHATSRSPPSTRRMRGQPHRRAADPRRLPAQPGDDRQGDAREVADVAHRVAAGGRRARRARRRAARRARRKTGTVEPAIKRAGKVIARGAGGERELPAAPREHRGRGRDARALLRGARRAARGVGRRRPPRRLPGLLPPARLGLRHPHGRGALGGARRLRRARRPGPPRLAAPQRLARRRWAPTATATPTSARASSAPTAARCSSPSRASTACRASRDARAGQARADAGAGAARQGPAPARAGEAAASGGARRPRRPAAAPRYTSGGPRPPASTARRRASDGMANG